MKRKEPCSKTCNKELSNRKVRKDVKKYCCSNGVVSEWTKQIKQTLQKTLNISRKKERKGLKDEASRVLNSLLVYSTRTDPGVIFPFLPS